MKRMLFLLAALLTLSASGAQERAQSLLRRLAATLGELEPYEVVFEVATERGPVAGRYRVDGDRYYMQVGRAEVYGDGECRREIDPSRREVVVDHADLSSRNLLNNPTRAFDFVGEEYDFAASDAGAGRVEVVMTPRRAGSVVERILVEVDAASALPSSVTYEVDGDRIRIAILSVGKSAEPVRRFDAARYAGFEIIDFR
ncbi:MAG: hypothetical protein K2O63_03430 [Alistipes sp.]|nr:hypothetical protein [Alistipes sp.]